MVLLTIEEFLQVKGFELLPENFVGRKFVVVRGEFDTEIFIMNYRGKNLYSFDSLDGKKTYLFDSKDFAIHTIKKILGMSPNQISGLYIEDDFINVPEYPKPAEKVIDDIKKNKKWLTVDEFFDSIGNIASVDDFIGLKFRVYFSPNMFITYVLFGNHEDNPEGTHYFVSKKNFLATDFWGVNFKRESIESILCDRSKLGNQTDTEILIQNPNSLKRTP